MPKKKAQQVDVFGEYGAPASSSSPADVRLDLLHNIEVLNKLLFSPKAKLRDAARAVNEMLTTVENILLSAFFKEYEKWIAESGGDISKLPDKLIALGEKIHKLIVARGKLVMDMMQQIKEDEAKEEEEGHVSVPSGGTLGKELFTLPPQINDYLEEDDE